jgi:hypothetical protein
MRVSRRGLLVGFGTLAAVPTATAKEWGTGRLLSWNGGEGLYQLDAETLVHSYRGLRSDVQRAFIWRGASSRRG